MFIDDQPPAVRTGWWPSVAHIVVFWFLAFLVRHAGAGAMAGCRPMPWHSRRSNRSAPTGRRPLDAPRIMSTGSQIAFRARVLLR